MGTNFRNNYYLSTFYTLAVLRRNTDVLISVPVVSHLVGLAKNFIRLIAGGNLIVQDLCIRSRNVQVNFLRKSKSIVNDKFIRSKFIVNLQ